MILFSGPLMVSDDFGLLVQVLLSGSTPNIHRTLFLGCTEGSRLVRSSEAVAMAAQEITSETLSSPIFSTNICYFIGAELQLLT